MTRLAAVPALALGATDGSSTGMTVTEVSSAGTALPFEHAANRLSIPLDRPTAMGGM